MRYILLLRSLKGLACLDLVVLLLAEFFLCLMVDWLRRRFVPQACRFEHVFVGEIDKGEVTGLHNWLQFANLERKGTLDYRGYIFPKRE